MANLDPLCTRAQPSCENNLSIIFDGVHKIVAIGAPAMRLSDTIRPQHEFGDLK